MPTRRQRDARRATLRPHPTRTQIIDVLAAHPEPLSPTRISQIIGQTLGSTAYHVRALAAAGLIEVVDEGRVRGAVEHFYNLTVDGRTAGLIDREKALLEICGALTQPAANGGLPTATPLDAKARAALTRVIESVQPKVLRIASDAAKRAA